MYKDAGFVVVSQQAIIRDRENNWKPIQYKAADPALPKKAVGRAKVPDTSFVGETKTIPEGRLVPKKARYLPTLRRFFGLKPRAKFLRGFRTCLGISAGAKNEAFFRQF